MWPAFLDQRHRENEILDYKRECPNDLEKVIAAFANTSGGLILLGVDEDGDSGRPLTPPCGFETSDGDDKIRAWVHSKAFDGIYPPITPQVAVVRLPDSPDRAMVLIRVLESHETPHATNQRSRIYVRVDSQSRFVESQATLERLELMWSRRRASETFRETLVRNANATLQTMRSLQDDEVSQRHTATIESYSIPCYPDHPRVDLGQLLKFAHDNFAESRGNKWPIYRVPSGSHVARPIADGVAILSRDTYDRVWVQVNQWGLVHTCAEIDPQDSQLPHGTVSEVYYAQWFIAHVDAWLGYLKALYSEFDLLTLKPVILRVTLTASPTSHVIWGHGPTSPSGYPLLTSTVRLLEETLIPGTLPDRRDHLVRECAERILWAGGLRWAANDDEVDKAMATFGLRGES